MSIVLSNIVAPGGGHWGFAADPQSGRGEAAVASDLGCLRRGRRGRHRIAASMQRERLHGISCRARAWRLLWRRPSAGKHKCFPRNWLGHDRHERSSRNPLFSNLPKPDLRLKRHSPHPLSPPAILPRPPSFFCGQRPARCRAKGHRRCFYAGRRRLVHPGYEVWKGTGF
jgi:hypothetical protein